MPDSAQVISKPQQPDGKVQTHQEVVAQVSEESQVLFEAQTFFPIDLFPTRVIVDTMKVNVIDKLFFGSEEVKSWPVKDILTVTLDRGPFLAQISIIDRFARQDPLVIRKLRIKDAKRLRQVIQGLVMASTSDVQLDVLPDHQLLPALEKLGGARA